MDVERSRWLVTGAGGMLGADVVGRLRRRGAPVRALGRSELNITDAGALARAVRDVDVVVNCAGWTAVDAAETDEAGAFAVNATGAQLLARATAAAGARLVHVSTDYVFDGESTAPYREDTALAPRSAYGRSKAAGEWAVRAECADHLVLRTAWLYGAHGRCFPRTIAGLLAEHGHVEVVADQTGQPTWTADVADLLLRLVAADAPSGIYHATASGRATWYELARAVAVATGRDPGAVRPTTTAPGGHRAPRPAFSVLGHDRLLAVGVAPIGRWDQRWREASSRVLGTA